MAMSGSAKTENYAEQLANSSVDLTFKILKMQKVIGLASIVRVK